MDEFVFGSLSTIEQRVAYLRAAQQGIRHNNRLTPLAPQPEDSPLLTVTVQMNQPIAELVCMVSLPTTAVYPLQRVKTEWDLLNWAYVETWQVRLPAQPGNTLVRYQIKATVSGQSEPIYADDGRQFSYLVADHTPPAWAYNSITYQIFPDRFYPGNGRSWNPATSLNDIYGGTLRGIIEKLDYVADMGFNAIWLNPFFPDDNTHHGYHATDYFSVNPRLGSMEDIRELVDAAHKRGIRLILDFVANHWSSQHHSFQEALKDPQSRYYEWYHWIDYPHDYETFFGVMHLPQVNVDHPEVRQYLIDSVCFWLTDVGFDGLRCDYALGPSHDFWTELRTAVKQTKPDAWVFGEVVESPSTILSYQGRFDGCLDFPLMQALRDTFAMGRMSITAFDTFLQQHETYFPDDYPLPSFLDNHDMNRFSWLAGNDIRKIKLAALCQFTLSGPPVVYNGSEVGTPQRLNMRDPHSDGMAECRQPMRWGDEQDADLRDYYRWLIHFRLAHPSLQHGRRQTLFVDETRGLYGYVRDDGTQMVWVGLNISETAQTVTAVYQGHEHTFHLAPCSGDVWVQP